MNLRRLTHVDTMAGSMSVYLPAMLLQRGLTLVRAVLFVWLLGQAQFGLWSLATMVMSLGSTVVTLGGFHGIQRYVSQYQAQGRLGMLYRASIVRLGLLATFLTACAALLGPYLAPWAMGTLSADSSVGAAQRSGAFLLGLINALLMALYLNLAAWLRGLRMYRLLSVLDVSYGAIFLVAALAVLALRASAQAALVAHAASLGFVTAGGLAALRHVVRASGGAPRPGADGTLRRVLRFSTVAMQAMLLWQAQSYASLWMIQRFHDMDAAGRFQPYFLIAQLPATFATAAWTVVYSHVAVHWEAGRHDLARRQLEMSFKAMMLLLTVLAVAMYASAGLWVRVLPPDVRTVAPVVPWLLMYFLALSAAGYAHMVSNLRERPRAWVLAALAATLVNVATAAVLVPRWGVPGGAVATALAGLACVATAGGWLLRGRPRPAAAGWALHLLPALLFLPAWAAAAVLAVLLSLTAATGWVFGDDEKQRLADALRRFLSPNRPGC